MQESTVYRSILAEGEVKKQREIATNSLREGIPIATVARITGLSIEGYSNFSSKLTILHKIELVDPAGSYSWRHGITITPMQQTSKVFALRFWLARRR